MPKLPQVAFVNDKYDDMNARVEPARKKEKSQSKGQRKPLRPGKQAFAYQYSEEEEEQDEALGNELLGRKRIEKLTSFCTKLSSVFCCRNKFCFKLCRRRSTSRDMNQAGSEDRNISDNASS